MTDTIRVAQLRKGDVLTGSGALVLARPTPFALPRIRGDKLALTVRYSNGDIREVYWGASTRVTVERSAI